MDGNTVNDAVDNCVRREIECEGIPLPGDEGNRDARGEVVDNRRGRVVERVLDDVLPKRQGCGRCLLRKLESDERARAGCDIFGRSGRIVARDLSAAGGGDVDPRRPQRAFVRKLIRTYTHPIQ